MTFPKFPTIEFSLERSESKVVLEDLVPSLQLRKQVSEQFTLSSVSLDPNGESMEMEYVVAVGTVTLSRVKKRTVVRSVERHPDAWQAAAGDKLRRLLVGDRDDESGLGLDPVPKSVRVSGPDARGAEADLAKLQRRREKLQLKLVNLPSKQEQTQTRAQLEWVDDVIGVISTLELAD